jgi:2-hydroxychromene-2-carboxylate isomerase
MRLDFYFDYASPFAYLASTQVERISAAHHAELHLHPILVGALFRAIGTPIVPLETFSKAKRDYFMTDMKRWADHWDVPFVFPRAFPVRTVKPLRLTLALPESDRLRLIQTIMKAVWIDERDPDCDEVLRDCLATSSLDASYLERVSDPSIKTALRLEVQSAVDAAIPGVPSITIDGGDCFWGQDRLVLVEAALRSRMV